MRTVLWRRLDVTGLDAARLEQRGESWSLGGTAIVTHEERPCALQYEVVCDGAWRTREARVTGWIGSERVDVRLVSDGAGHWRRDGEEQPQVGGCLDVDLAFTPATNTLPIRRLGLEVGASADVTAAWLRFPELAFVPLPQGYGREGDRAYRYESNGGAFVARLEVDDAGLVRRYGDLWRAE